MVDASALASYILREKDWLKLDKYIVLVHLPKLVNYYNKKDVGEAIDYAEKIIYFCERNI